MTIDDLDLRFCYHAPNASTAPRYARIRAAEEVAHREVYNAIHQARRVAGAQVKAFDTVNAACKAFGAVVLADAPPCVDLDQAVLLLGRARNFANEAILSAAVERVGEVPLERWRSSDVLEVAAHTHLLAVRMAANSAVALVDAAVGGGS